jgi:predicted nucleotidyltransferase
MSIGNQGRIALALQRLVSATDRGLPRRLWRLGYELVARAVGWWLTRGEPGAAVHVRGSVAHGDAVHGVSDIDLIVVVPGDPAAPGPARQRVERRRRELERRIPALAALVTVGTYEARELREAVVAPAPTWPGDGALFTRTPYLEDALWLRSRPGVYGPTADWRRLRGPATLPAPPPRDAQDERIAAWLELQWWWRHAIAACSRPEGPRTRYLLVKFVVEPLRLLLWLEHRERVEGRRRLLEVARRRLDGVDAAVEDALRLLDALPRKPAPPLAAMLPHLVDLSERVAATIAAQVAAEGVDEVPLVGAGEAAPAGGGKSSQGGARPPYRPRPRSGSPCSTAASPIRVRSRPPCGRRCRRTSTRRCGPATCSRCRCATSGAPATCARCRRRSPTRSRSRCSRGGPRRGSRACAGGRRPTSGAAPSPSAAPGWSGCRTTGPRRSDSLAPRCCSRTIPCSR